MDLVSIFKAIGRGIGKLISKALGFAKDSGLSDKIVSMALEYVKGAAVSYLSNDEKRETVVLALKKHGIKESIARLAVEIAYQLYKKESAENASN